MFINTSSQRDVETYTFISCPHYCGKLVEDAGWEAPQPVDQIDHRNQPGSPTWAAAFGLAHISTPLEPETHFPAHR
jgi:hypothetical protein